VCSKKHCKINLCCYVVLKTTCTKSHAIIIRYCICSAYWCEIISRPRSNITSFKLLFGNSRFCGIPFLLGLTVPQQSVFFYVIHTVYLLKCCISDIQSILKTREPLHVNIVCLSSVYTLANYRFSHYAIPVLCISFFHLKYTVMQYYRI